MTCEFTGERIVPGKMQGWAPVFAEHMERYAYASEFCGDKDVLDIACGTGFGMSLLSCVARRITGIDISPEAVEFARLLPYFCEADHLVGDAKDCWFIDDCFDLVVSFETIEHLDNPVGFIKKCHSYLKPGGLMIASVPLVDYLTPYHKHTFDEDSFFKLFEDAGFEHVNDWKQRGLFSIVTVRKGRPYVRDSDSRL